eukprot:CAMPEP_0182562128 /NCGR_PEP_ID=MMETSP1324-20130603/4514_1 /TAXON_ID=236786 /ORGANISM="Florenciella sp., Strain RCC1587" /LENGTH=64 /DNA_ID=CAMNT_0024774967 /DNA_START=91 /DNA_END=281 /DNA_ORIENTATION=+
MVVVAVVAAGVIAFPQKCDDVPRNACTSGTSGTSVTSGSTSVTTITTTYAPFWPRRTPTPPLRS